MTINAKAVPSEARSRIVTRDGTPNTRVYAAQIQTADELAYAIRFLTDHFIYKRSKALCSPNREAIKQAGAALVHATDSLFHDVAKPNGVDSFGTPKAEEKPISRLGEGVIVNPYDLV